MSTQNESGLRTFQASGSISAFRVVDIQSDGTITAAANNVKGIGVTQMDIDDADYGSVRLWTAPGTWLATVSGTAVTVGNDYSVITGGYIGVVNGTVNVAYVTAFQNGVASNGIILEFLNATV